MKELKIDSEVEKQNCEEWHAANNQQTNNRSEEVEIWRDGYSEATGVIISLLCEALDGDSGLRTAIEALVSQLKVDQEAYYKSVLEREDEITQAEASTLMKTTNELEARIMVKVRAMIDDLQSTG
ncbi:hypothetical protein WDW37_08045 [Bdellovibrionota bacterium FG-1]